MPLSPLEPSIYPEDLLQPAVDAEECPPSWWALHTRPRAEKALARHCLGRHLSFFLPLYRRQWQKNHRSFQAYLPLFPGYVFLRGDGEARLRALESNLIARVLPVPDPAQLCADLDRVHRMIQSQLPLAPRERLQPGAAVEVVSGPLAGMQGTLLRCGKKNHFFVEVQILQCGVSVEMEGWMLRSVAPPRQCVS
jgi:transcriptional antiterminator RfaH